MSTCAICGEKLGPDARSCHICGTSVPIEIPARSRSRETSSGEIPRTLTSSATKGGKQCPCCGKVYDADYTDDFCECGIELTSGTPPTVQSDAPTVLERPAPGTPCLVLFGANKKPIKYHPLAKDTTLIGRLDAVAGIFPDVDVMQSLDPSLARKVSRQHALILRSRVNKSFSLRPLAGNTGTQIETEMVAALQDYPLSSGSRLVLGGAVCMKFEIT